jgi:hypothetical protein
MTRPHRRLSHFRAGVEQDNWTGFGAGNLAHRPLSFRFRSAARRKHVAVRFGQEAVRINSPPEMVRKGVLTMKLPKKAEAQKPAKKIEVKAA